MRCTKHPSLSCAAASASPSGSAGWPRVESNLTRALLADDSVEGWEVDGAVGNEARDPNRCGKRSRPTVPVPRDSRSRSSCPGAKIRRRKALDA